jgi:predicted nucleotidyltransferase
MTVIDASFPRDRVEVALRSGPPLRLAMLFGSSADGSVHAGSDVDIAILPEDPELSLEAELGLQSELGRITGRSVDLVRLDRAPTLVRYQVAKRGVPLLEAGPFEAARFVAAAVAEYLDFEPSLLRAAALFRRRVADGIPRDA